MVLLLPEISNSLTCQDCGHTHGLFHFVEHDKQFKLVCHRCFMQKYYALSVASEATHQTAHTIALED